MFVRHFKDNIKVDSNRLTYLDIRTEVLFKFNLGSIGGLSFYRGK